MTDSSSPTVPPVADTSPIDLNWGQFDDDEAFDMGTPAPVPPACSIDGNCDACQ
jgi:hypothetical protein